MVEVAQQQLAWLVITYMLGLRPTADPIWTRLSLTQLQLPLHRYQGLSHMMSHLERHPLCLEPPALQAVCEDLVGAKSRMELTVAACRVRMCSECSCICSHKLSLLGKRPPVMCRKLLILAGFSFETSLSCTFTAQQLMVGDAFQRRRVLNKGTTDKNSELMLTMAAEQTDLLTCANPASKHTLVLDNIYHNNCQPAASCRETLLGRSSSGITCTLGYACCACTAKHSKPQGAY